MISARSARSSRRDLVSISAISRQAVGPIAGLVQYTAAGVWLPMAVIALLHVVVLAIHVPLGVPLWSDPGDWDQKEPRKTPTDEPGLNGHHNDAEAPAGRAVKSADVVTVQCAPIYGRDLLKSQAR